MSVCPSGVCVSTLLNMNIYVTSRPIATILSEASLGWGKGRIRFWARSEQNSCDHPSAFIFDRIFFILAGNEDIHNISNEFEIQPDQTKDCGVGCL